MNVNIKSFIMSSWISSVMLYTASLNAIFICPECYVNLVEQIQFMLLLYSNFPLQIQFLTCNIRTSFQVNKTSETHYFVKPFYS